MLCFDRMSLQRQPDYPHGHDDDDVGDQDGQEEREFEKVEQLFLLREIVVGESSPHE